MLVFINKKCHQVNVGRTVDFSGPDVRPLFLALHYPANRDHRGKFRAGFRANLALQDPTINWDLFLERNIIPLKRVKKNVNFIIRSNLSVNKINFFLKQHAH